MAEQALDAAVMDDQALPNPPDPRHTDVTYWHWWVQEDQMPAWPEGRFTFVRTLSKAIYGEVDLRVDTEADDKLVVAKHLFNSELEPLRHRNPKGHEGGGGEDAFTEIGILRHISRRPAPCPFVQSMEGCFCAPQAKVLVTVFAGDEVFSVISAGAVNWSDQELMRYMWQLFSGVEYLHQLAIAHCDLSLENVLIQLSIQRMTIMDFGGSRVARTLDGRPLRYFTALGKPYYRVPESYLPGQRLQVVRNVVRPAGDEGTYVQISPRQHGPLQGYLFEIVQPDGAEGQVTDADLAGYDAMKADFFALGVCMFILKFHVPPWQRAQVMDKGFNFVRVRGIAQLVASWGLEMAANLIEVMDGLIQVNPALRWSAAQALAHESLEPAARANAHLQPVA